MVGGVVEGLIGGEAGTDDRPGAKAKLVSIAGPDDLRSRERCW